MNEELIKKRYKTLAVLFSMVFPGLGHLYVGKWKISIFIPFTFVLLIGAFAWTGLILVNFGMMLYVTILLLWYLGLMVWVFQLARNQSGVSLNKSQRWYFYILYVLVWYFLFGIVNSYLVQNRADVFGFESFHIPATSMAPTLIGNDFIMVDTWAYKNANPVVGDVVVFKYPRDKKVKYIKRIIAKPGDHVAYYDKRLFINRKEIKREFVGDYDGESTEYEMEEYTEQLGDIFYNITHIPSRPGQDAEYIVPENFYFVLGDSRDNSNDSRYWGMLDENLIHGKAKYIFFSISKSLGIRYDRFGQIIH